jgi:hypothetical protein
MSRKILAMSGTLLGIAFIVIVIGSYVIVAQSAITGTWKADVRSDENTGGKIQFNFERRTSGGRHNQTGFPIAIDDLQGLTRDQLQNGKVNFRLVREAGTIDCEGSFSNGTGSGTFRFTSNPGFVSAMSSRGFDLAAENRHGRDLEERLFNAAVINVTTALADDIRSAGLGPLDVDDLFKAAIFHIDSRFMGEMKATGFPGLKMEDLVKARIFKIDADYVRQVRDMGFSDRDFEGLVKFRIFKITPEFLSRVRAAGLTDLDPEEVVRLRIFKIDPEFIRSEKAKNPNVTVEDLVRMKIGVHGRRDRDRDDDDD